MDWADDVAYSVHDLEDGIVAGLVPLGLLTSEQERQALAEHAAADYSPESAADLEQVWADLTARRLWPASYDGTASAQAALKQATSTLIGRFCGSAETATRAAHGPQALGRYGADLQVPRRVRAECALLKAVAARWVMARPGVAAAQEREREIVVELVGRIAERGPEALEPAHADAWRDAPDEAARLRAVVDQVASLTDAAAAALHARYA